MFSWDEWRKLFYTYISKYSIFMGYLFFYDKFQIHWDILPNNSSLFVKSTDFQIGQVKHMFLIDYEEDDLLYTLGRRRAEGGRADDEELPSSRRLQHFKEETLPVCKYYEDQNRLLLVSLWSVWKFRGISASDVQRNFSDWRQQRSCNHFANLDWNSGEEIRHPNRSRA